MYKTASRWNALVISLCLLRVNWTETVGRKWFTEETRETGIKHVWGSRMSECVRV